jgi:hypothetical protein
VHLTGKDREALQTFLRLNSSTDQSTAFLQQLLQRAEQEKNKHFPLYQVWMGAREESAPSIIGVRSLPKAQPESDVQCKADEELPRYIKVAAKWAKDKTFVKAFDGGVPAKSAFCGIGKHEIEVGDPICRIYFDLVNGDPDEKWGCQDCVYFLADEYGFKVERQ